MEWFENIGMYADQEPAQFVFNLLTRSRRITFDNLAERDAEFAARMEAEFGRSDAFDPMRCEQFPNFAQLAGVVGCDDQLGTDCLHLPAAFN